MSVPKISIILATYNRAHLIGAAIQSVRDQTFTDWELIVADDASSDNTAAVVKKRQVKDPRIQYWHSPINVGIARNSNAGLRLAHGEYIAIIDDDDRWCDSRKLEKQTEFLNNHPACVAVGGGVIVVNDRDEEITRYLKPESDEAIRDRMLFDNPLANSATMFRRSAAEQVGFYDQSLRYAADRDFFLKIGLTGKLYNMPEYFVRYLLAGQNTSTVKIKEHLASSLAVMRRYRSNYPHYRRALIINRLQYYYSFLPSGIRDRLHVRLFRLKRLVFR